MMRRLHVRAALLAATLVFGGALGGCAASDVSVDAVRQAAATSTPTNCPITLDVPAALKSAGVDRPVRLESADSAVSTGDSPASDPFAAVRSGRPPLEATAGAHIECEYHVNKDRLRVRLVASRANDSAIALLAPQIARDADLPLKDLNGILNALPEPGDIRVVGGSVAIARLDTDEGDAAMIVSSDIRELQDAPLSAVTGTLIEQLNF